jgi:hypothetical protein
MKDLRYKLLFLLSFFISQKAFLKFNRGDKWPYERFAIQVCDATPKLLFYIFIFFIFQKAFLKFNRSDKWPYERFAMQVCDSTPKLLFILSFLFSKKHS